MYHILVSLQFNWILLICMGLVSYIETFSVLFHTFSYLITFLVNIDAQGLILMLLEGRW